MLSEVFGLFHVSGIDVDEDYLYLKSSRNEEGISIINKQSLAPLFAVDDEYIYVLHNNENGESFLARYPNTGVLPPL